MVAVVAPAGSGGGGGTGGGTERRWQRRWRRSRWHGRRVEPRHRLRRSRGGAVRCRHRLHRWQHDRPRQHDRRERHVTNPAPQVVYQADVWATSATRCKATLPTRTACGYFAETYFSTGSRVFNVSINGSRCSPTSTSSRLPARRTNDRQTVYAQCQRERRYLIPGHSVVNNNLNIGIDVQLAGGPRLIFGRPHEGTGALSVASGCVGCWRRDTVCRSGRAGRAWQPGRSSPSLLRRRG